VREEPQVTKPRLVIFKQRRLHVVIEYTYEHHVAVDPKVTTDRFEITDILAGRHKDRVYIFGGLVPGVAMDSPEDLVEHNLNDADSGMLSIVKRWKARCGVTVMSMTV
jgi:hypothetical protein